MGDLMELTPNERRLIEAGCQLGPRWGTISPLSIGGENENSGRLTSRNLGVVGFVFGSMVMMGAKFRHVEIGKGGVRNGKREVYNLWIGKLSAVVTGQATPS